MKIFKDSELARSHARVATDYLEAYASTGNPLAGRLAIDALTRALVFVGRAQVAEPHRHDEMAELGLEQVERLVALLTHKNAPAGTSRQGEEPDSNPVRKPTSPANVSARLKQIKPCCPCPPDTDGLLVIGEHLYECPCGCHVHHGHGHGPCNVVESVTWSTPAQACTA